MEIIRVYGQDACFWGSIEKKGQSKTFVIQWMSINNQKKTLRFPHKPEFDSLSVHIIYQEKRINEIEKLIIPKNMLEFFIPDHTFPKLTSIEVEEGAPFYARGVNLFSREGKLLNFFRLDQAKWREESSIPFDPERDIKIEGDCLAALLVPTETLVLPPKVRRISQKAFFWHAPRRLVCSRLLGSVKLDPDPFEADYARVKYCYNVGYIKELVLTDPKAPLSRDLLFYFVGLESISLPNGHRIYETRDGILYKDHGTTLVFIPPRHPKIRRGTFVIPWGVRRLGGRLFEGLKRLKRVEMPDTVCKMGGGIFAHCENLEYVRLSDNMIRIPGGAICKGGPLPCMDPAFLSCTSLTQLHFPKHLASLGEGAFEGSGITRVELPEGTEEVGEDCFSDCKHLTEVLLPKSLKRVGKRAFPCLKGLKIWAYEGSAKGLLSSISFRSDYHITWIHVLNAKGALRICIPALLSQEVSLDCIPVLQERDAKLDHYLSQAWDGERLRLGPLLQCIPMVPESQRRELILIALCHLDKEAFAPYEKYRKRRLTDYGIDLIERDRRKDFIRFLRLAKPNKRMRRELLDYCNQTGRDQFILLFSEEDKPAK